VFPYALDDTDRFDTVSLFTLLARVTEPWSASLLELSSSDAT
jgi:hypothetical protein